MLGCTVYEMIWSSMSGSVLLRTGVSTVLLNPELASMIPVLACTHHSVGNMSSLSLEFGSCFLHKMTENILVTLRHQCINYEVLFVYCHGPVDRSLQVINYRARSHTLAKK